MLAVLWLILEFSKRRIAQDVRKLLQSAIANAENNHGLDVDRLVVSEATVGKTMMMKRFRARARGRGARIEKKILKHDNCRQRTRSIKGAFEDMGQKVNPIGLRVGINRTWDSRWYAGRDYADKLVEDLKLREFVQEKLKAAGISKVIIERAAKTQK